MCFDFVSDYIIHCAVESCQFQFPFVCDDLLFTSGFHCIVLFLYSILCVGVRVHTCICALLLTCVHVLLLTWIHALLLTCVHALLLTSTFLYCPFFIIGLLKSFFLYFQNAYDFVTACYV